MTKEERRVQEKINKAIQESGIDQETLETIDRLMRITPHIEKAGHDKKIFNERSTGSPDHTAYLYE